MRNSLYDGDVVRTMFGNPVPRYSPEHVVRLPQHLLALSLRTNYIFQLGDPEVTILETGLLASKAYLNIACADHGYVSRHWRAVFGIAVSLIVFVSVSSCNWDDLNKMSKGWKCALQ